MKAYTVTISGNAVACIIEDDVLMAEDIIERDYFRGDLMALESEGQPLWDGQAKIELREATAEEAARAHIAAARMQVSNKEDPIEAGMVIFLGRVSDPTDYDDEGEDD